MGYKIPGNSSDFEKNYTSSHSGLWRNMLSFDAVEVLGKLIDSYNGINDNSSQEFNLEDNYLMLYKACGILGITAGKSKDELFPHQTKDQFYRDFQKLWNSISIYQELAADEDEELSENADLSDIFNNYSESYERYLLEAEALDYLSGEVILKVSDDPNANEYKEALKKLNFYRSRHTANEPFNEEELAKIQKQTSILGKHFDEQFSGDDIETPRDLDEYLKDYETMLHNLSLYDFHVSFRDFAKDYSVAEIDKGYLTAHEIKTFDKMRERRKFNYSNSIDIQKQNADMYNSMSNDVKLNAQIQDANKNGLDILDQACESEKKKLQDDEELNSLKEEYKKEYASCRRKLERYQSVKGELGKRQIQKNEWGENNSYISEIADYKKVLDSLDELTNIFSFERERQNLRAAFKSEMDKSSRIISGDRTDLMRYVSYERRDELDKLNTKQSELDKNPNEEEQEKLDHDKEEVEKEFTRRLKESEILRDNYFGHMGDMASKYGNKISDSYKEELETSKKLFREAMKKMKDASAAIDESYQNSDYGKRMNKQDNVKRAEIKEEISKVINALSAEKKTNLFGFKKANSKEYDDMLTAVQEYQSGRIDAEVAHEACEKYLKLSLDENGIKNMGSGLGKLRKQGCVRLMELLSETPMFIKDARGIEKPMTAQERQEAIENPRNVKRRERINYDVLENSLGQKSDKLKKKVTYETARKEKAFTNLNKKIENVQKKK